MKVYQVLKDCSISYTDKGEDASFFLQVGDYIFIEINTCWVRKQQKFAHERTYSKESILTKIYYKKLISFGDKPSDEIWEWTWIENINIVDPYIKIKEHFVTVNYFDGRNPYTGATPPCKDVTKQWERDEKLNTVLNIEKN